MKHQASILLLTQHNQVQLARLAYLTEYSRQIQDTAVKLALAQAIEDTQEAIARVASRLRQLGEAPGRALDEAHEKLVRQARSRRGLAEQLKFVHQGIRFQLEWYEARAKEVSGDADTQAILVALAEQTRLRLSRWADLLTEMKVSLG
ncbi:MAG: hypothetical protein AB1801_11340 [Chloroflexota bacterium]